MKTKLIALMMALIVTMTFDAYSQQFTDVQMAQIQKVVLSNLPPNMGIGTPKAKSVVLSGDTVVVDLTENFADIPFTRESVAKLRQDFAAALGAPYDKKPMKITIIGNDINKYFVDYKKEFRRKHDPFVTPLDANKRYKKGLDGNIIAVWPSHGLYFENQLNRWEWQRGRLMQTVEDMYTHSYMIPFIMPMLENAGAYVWDARERDTHNIGAVVDNDGGQAQKGYAELNNGKSWTAGNGNGFAYARATYKDFENPFEEGTYRQVEVTKDKNKQSYATWSVDMPEAGTFAVYISYKTLPGSVRDALYTVNSLAGSQQFTVDQTMAGGVWVYLGSFPLKKGLNENVVTLSNLSKAKNGVVTADAIRVGGGKGNIVRRVALPTPENKALAQEQKNERYLGKEGVQYDYIGSGDYPWFTIGSRYYLQWAGFPASVYSESQGINDYTDDYRSRGEWVNYLAAGSQVIPNKKGLNVPVDLSFCLHTDAGVTPDDKTVGTLTIYSTRKDGKDFGNYEDGTPRIMSRNFGNFIATEVTNDIRAKYDKDWARRGLWDRSYYEARVPEVPALLIELLSHQNFADMKLGLDPMFRFDVSRAFYKGMLKFLAARDGKEYVVQPLPVNSFAINDLGAGKFALVWKPTADALSENADAKQYIILERVGGIDEGFKEIAIVNTPSYEVTIRDNKVHSYRIIAMNEGGRSFPSETLSLGVAPSSKGTVAVVNAFDRVSAPDWFEAGEIGGFLDEKDHGVPYIQQINYLGAQYEFRREKEWKDDDNPGFGASRSNHETQVIAGNTFDFPIIHGEALMTAGYSFVSCSAKALADGIANFGSDVKAMDIIAGKQKTTMVATNDYGTRHTLFPEALRNAVTAFTQGGGNVLLTGAFVGTDVMDNPAGDTTAVKFAKEVLGYQLHASRSAQISGAESVPTIFGELNGLNVKYNTEMCDRIYAVESPDALKASDSKGVVTMRYSENGKPAAVASNRGNYSTFVAGFPFETITDQSERNAFMNAVMNFFNK